jgi:hypothetical protein
MDRIIDLTVFCLESYKQAHHQTGNGLHLNVLMTTRYLTISNLFMMFFIQQDKAI